MIKEDVKKKTYLNINELAPKTTEGSSSDVIPSCLDDEWAEWIEIGDNLSKWEASFDE